MLNIAYSGVNPNWLKGSCWLNKAPSSPFLSQAGTDPSVGNIREEKITYSLSFPGAQSDRGQCWGQVSTLAGPGASAPGLGSEQPCLGQCGLTEESDLAPSLLLPLHFSLGVTSSCCFVVACTAREQANSQTYFWVSKEKPWGAVRQIVSVAENPKVKRLLPPAWLHLPVSSFPWRLSALCSHLCMATL